ncbi:MAG: hypothetical protein ACI9SB_000313 [Candidatus Azotimanducaceae bacterium]|jgi:hypothetical protein
MTLKAGVELMKTIKIMMRRICLAAGLVLLAGVVPMIAQAAPVEENPTGAAMVGDILIARPLGLLMFAAGSVVYLATLPFSLAGGNASDAGERLVLEPAKEVFVRCLGCTHAGYKESLGH